MSQIQSILLAFRPKTLTAALVPCIGATALCMGLHLTPDGKILFYSLVSSFLIQIGTNLINDAKDFKKGADTEKRIGPQRITQSGVLSYKAVMRLGFLAFALAMLAGIPLVLKGGIIIVAIGIASLAMGYCYTGGPFPLAYIGMGDLFVILFFGLVATGGMFFLHTGQWGIASLVLGLQIGFHATVLIAINNLRDMDTDKLVNKRTLAVRWGKRFVRYEIATLVLTPFVMNLYWIRLGFYGPILFSLFVLPIGGLIIKNVFTTEPSEKYNRYLGQAAGLHLFFGVALSIGFLWNF